MDHVKERLKDYFETTIESGVKYDGKFSNMNYYKLYCKAGKSKLLYKLLGCDVFLLNCSYEGDDAVMIIFQISTSSENSEEMESITGAKNIAERVMEIIANLERCFVTLDYVMSEEAKEEKLVYVTAIKKV